ncbi:MAG: BON domain-containing protein [Alphaproteobacteria bacterium]|nr:BON domain-containing protein [Alphaproteobacteria bacterium]
MSIRSISRILAVALAPLFLSACVGISLDPEERSFSSAVDDFDTRTELNAKLLAEDPRIYTNVSTSVIEGRVHLSGTVLTDEQRRRVTQLAWSTAGVTEVVNDIEVTDETSGIVATARDRWINTKIRARILADTSIHDVNYTIDTQNRVVFIMGIAQDRGELDRVLDHARAIDGVERVVNYVVLKDDPRRFTEPPAQYGHPTEPEAPPDAEPPPTTAAR